MNRSRSLKAAVSLALTSILALAAGCTTTTDDSGPTCDTDPTVSCTDGTGYSCTGTDRPEDSVSSIFCSDGQAGNAGSTLYCCLSKDTADTTCGDDPTVSCPGGGFGFSCSDATEPPTQAYPSLNCSSPVAGNAGSATYCCTD
jgi:hypothetical protein